MGTVPFGPCETPVEVYECIIKGVIRYNDIASLSAPARDIIQGLLKTDRTRRLGNMRNGALDVKNHPWVSYGYHNQYFWWTIIGPQLYYTTLQCVVQIRER